MTDEEWVEVIQTNLNAVFFCTSAAIKIMADQKYGRIVNAASIAGQIGHPDIWYGISKAGLINVTKSFARILGPNGITVNASAPGPVQTAMLDSIPEARREQIKRLVITGRFAEPREIAKTMVWLATECPEYINGVCIDINNGAFLR